MRWYVRIVEVCPKPNRLRYEIIATNLAPVPFENPDHLVAILQDRDAALWVAREFCDKYGCKIREAEVIAFLAERRAA